MEYTSPFPNLAIHAKGTKWFYLGNVNAVGPRMRLNDGRVLPAFIGQALRKTLLSLVMAHKRVRFAMWTI